MLLQKKGLRTIDHALAATPPRQNRPQAALQKSEGHSRRRLLFGLVWACVSGYNGAAFLFDQLMREFRQAPFGRTTPDASMIRSWVSELGCELIDKIRAASESLVEHLLGEGEAREQVVCKELPGELVALVHDVS